MNWSRILIVCPPGPPEETFLDIALAGIAQTKKVRVLALRELAVERGILTHRVGDSREGVSPRAMKRATFFTMAPPQAEQVQRRLLARGLRWTSLIRVDPAGNGVDHEATKEPQRRTRR